ncbi:hypothetical protein RF11_10847 [Thelohanellus kitauei]|uniref:Uncharacterized protein n=1 Tax=Thelohanellus kitauei TaxID=669202 RepID=A0A0C2M843_THEKT|nr:hypothetical protein RF11_05608 [Thelohanellus kitauei]KII65481.1 hypothetical protein RF11_10847 [Thelohanellus kitauei]
MATSMEGKNSTCIDSIWEFKFDTFSKDIQPWAIFKKSLEHLSMVHTGGTDKTDVALMRDAFLNYVGPTLCRLVLENFSHKQVDEPTYNDIINFLERRYEKTILFYTNDFCSEAAAVTLKKNRMIT